MQNLKDALYAALNLEPARRYAELRRLRYAMARSDAEDRAANLSQIDGWLNSHRTDLLVTYGGYDTVTDEDLSGFDAAYDAYCLERRDRQRASETRRQAWFVRIIVASAHELGRTDDLRTLITPIAVSSTDPSSLDAYLKAEAAQDTRRDLLMHVLLDHAGFDADTFERQIRAFWRDPHEDGMLAA